MWSYCHRGISPLPPAYPIMGRHSPWEDRGSSSALMMSIPESAIHSYLPAFNHCQLGGSLDYRRWIDRLVENSEETMPSTKWNPLEEQELREAYKWMIRILSRVSPGEADYVISHDLMQKLEERLATDQKDAREVNGGQFYHRRAQHLFRSLAEVSSKTESIKLGTVLLRFFSRNAELIASTEDAPALGQWCYAILSAVSRDSDRLECLQKILRIRPDLAHSIRGKGRKAREVADMLDWVDSHMNLGDRGRRGGHGHSAALRSPHHVAGLEDDLFIDGLGEELAMFSQRSGRGRSRDGLLMPHHQGRLDRGPIEERVYAGPRMMSLPDFRPERGAFERSLWLHEDQDRRMLQFTMGQSYGDSPGAYGTGMGETMVPRVPRLSTNSEVEYDI